MSRTLVMVHRSPAGRLAWVRTEVTDENEPERRALLQSLATPGVEHRLFVLNRYRGEADLRLQVAEHAPT